jgi:glycosyltransferase involved in cell wall biosynthesis/ubiquinone/menaquinone biosynthesis C-methylase UbiE
MQPWISYRGAETVSVQQAYYLQKAGHQVKIAAIFVDWERLPIHGRDVDYILPPAFLSRFCQQNQWVLFFLGPILLFWIVLLQINTFEVLNPHNLPSIWVAGVLKKIFNKRVIWTCHNVPTLIAWNEKKSLFEYFVWKFGTSILDTWAVRQADVILAVSKQVGKDVKRRYGKVAVVLYPGLREMGQELQKSKLKNKNLEIGGVRFASFREQCAVLFLSVGALHPQKRVQVSLEAFRKFHEKFPASGFIFVGDGPERDTMKRYVESHGLSEWVCFAGFVPQEDVAAFYQLCDLQVLPSIGESFSAAPLEALSFGKLSVISPSNGAREVLGEYSLVCESTADEVYKRMVLFWKQRSEWFQLEKDGEKYIRERLDWKNYVDEFVKMTKDISKNDIKAVDSDVYNKDYYTVHYEKEHPALVRERETRMARAVQLLQVKKGMKVLDLGCGIGDLDYRLAKLGVAVYGVDYSAEGIVLAEARKKEFGSSVIKLVHFQQMDAMHLDFSDNFFDRIVCLDVFEHIYPEPLEQVIREMSRVTKSGGRIVIETAPNSYFLSPVSFLAKRILGWEKFESDEYHINVYNLFRFRRTLALFPGKVYATVLNDSHQFFSSRLAGVRGMPGWMKLVARVVDFLHENAVVEPLILHSPLKIFLAHDLWGVVEVEK